MNARVHRAARVGDAEASVIVTVPDTASLNDAEEAIKQGARDAIRATRERLRGSQ